MSRWSSFGMSAGRDLYTKVLLHFDGTAGTPVFTDSAPNNTNTWVGSGPGVQLADSSSGLAPKFGSAYLLTLNNVHLYCTAKPEFNLSNKDFTVDFWWCKSLSSVYYLTGQVDSGETFAGSSFYILSDNTGKLQFTVSNGTSSASVLSTTSLPTGTVWHHIAGTRNGNILRLFLNGVQEGGDISFTGTVPNSSADLSVFSLGSSSPTNPGNGLFDEYRLSVGIARWTTNFTPPIQPYG